MDLETAQITTTAKLLTLKQGKYDMWRLRIEQYFQVQDYALWDVIENENSFKPAGKTTTNADGTSTTLILGLVTTEEKYKDAKTLFTTIQTRFGGNEATKKTQKILLKQMYENFSALSTESLDSIFNRLQKIVSQLAILGEYISQEDLNLKFLRSLPSEWNTYVVVWRNKPDLDTMSFDDLYNNFKIIKQELGHFAREYRGTRNQDSRNRNQDSYRRTVNMEETSSKAMLAIDGAGFDWSYMEDDEVLTKMALMAFSDFEIPNKSRKGLGFVSYNAVPPPSTGLFSPPNLDLSYSGLEEFQQPEFEGYGSKPSKSVSEDTSNEIKESPDTPLVEELVLDDNLEKKTIFPTVAKIEFVRAKQ
ncbi:hypothetical protein Tco_0398483 [Tanacetum coccineum]